MKLKELKEALQDKTLTEKLKYLSGEFRDKIIFTTSFGIEDQAIAHMIFSGNLPVKVATIDTGRLFPQTLDVYSMTLIKYKKKIQVFFPDADGVEKIVTEKGPYSFYKSVEDRKECCNIRKVKPLARALKGMECWISGIRSDQSDNRMNLEWLEYDQNRNIIKFYPLFDWSYEEVLKYARDNNIPFNSLHDKGYVSIGCEPCTKAVRKGEDPRSGRWWWENDGLKECGLHMK